MQPQNEKDLELDGLVCNEELKTKKRAINIRQSKMLSELSQKISELKNDLYQMDSKTED